MSFKDIVGQDRALRRLKSLLSTRAIPPALIFQGPRGVGKAVAALAFAKALNCSKRKTDCCQKAADNEGEPCPRCIAVDKNVSPDIHNVNADYQAALLDDDPAKQRSIRVDTVRHIIRDLEMRSLEGRWKTAILHGAHSLVPAAANAMLKSLEEPPPGTVWILVTHRPTELLATIRSRCQPVSFGPLTQEKIADILTEMQTPADEAAAVSSLAEGSVGRALEILGQEQSSPSEWLSDPLGPFQLADALPRGLHLSRPIVEDHIHRMTWHIRRNRGPEGYSSAQVRGALRDLAEFRLSLRSNADPRIVLELAALRLQRLHNAGGLPS